MKKAYSIALIMLFILSNYSCNNNSGKKEIVQSINTADVNVYYFHFTRRCATCLAVEENARKAVGELYPNEVKTGDYSFTSLNLEEPGTKEIADKLGVGGQSLMIVHGDKKIDITSAAWLSAHDLGKMKTEIKSGIDKILF